MRELSVAILVRPAKPWAEDQSHALAGNPTVDKGQTNGGIRFAWLTIQYGESQFRASWAAKVRTRGDSAHLQRSRRARDR